MCVVLIDNNCTVTDVYDQTVVIVHCVATKSNKSTLCCNYCMHCIHSVSTRKCIVRRVVIEEAEEVEEAHQVLQLVREVVEVAAAPDLTFHSLDMWMVYGFVTAQS